MTYQEQARKIKCPHCGWIRTVPVAAVTDEATATVVRGLSEALQAAAARIQALLADAALDEANAWVDMPACPHCGHVYRYHVRTGEVAK